MGPSLVSGFISELQNELIAACKRRLPVDQNLVGTFTAHSMDFLSRLLAAKYQQHAPGGWMVYVSQRH
jgi:hypothetical protein